MSGVTSTNTGVTPARAIGEMSVENVTGEVMISSPGWGRSSSIARYRAEDPLLTMTPRRLSKVAATNCSSLRTFLPMRIAVDDPLSTSTTAAISSSPCTLPA